MTACLLLASACAGGETAYQDYLARRNVLPPDHDTIRHCQGYGCQKITEVRLAPPEWRAIAALFRPAAADAAQERARVSAAIGLFERIIGPRTGTEKDVAGTFRKTGEGQLDCVDESTNTTSYLAMLQARGLLKFHALEGPTMRLPIINAGHWPHQTAVIREKATGHEFVVDSWFRDNGAPADIAPLEAWKNGWKPQNVDGFL